jgi:hypothetical protein
MGIALYILISYLVSVLVYAVVVRNNPTNKRSPNTRVRDFLKEGFVGMGIGFLIAAIIIGAIIGGVIIYNNYIY